jgi:hypothetical protein
MKIFTRLFKNFAMVKVDNKLLMGRWVREYDTKILERKVYLANMDHCGCCENIKKNKEKKNFIDNDDHLIPYLL